MVRLPKGFADFDTRPGEFSASADPSAREQSRSVRGSVSRTYRQWPPWLALILSLAAPSDLFAQSQQMNTVIQPGQAYSVTSDGLGNIFFPLGGYVGELAAGSTSYSYLQPAVGSGVPYPFNNSIVAVVSDVAGDLFVAVQNPIVAGTSGPYVDVFEITNAPVFFTGNTSGSNQITSASSTAGLVAGQYVTGPGIPGGDYITDIVGTTIYLEYSTLATASGVAFQAPVYAMGPQVYGLTTPPPLVNGANYSTLNSMAYDNLNAFLYLNFYNGNDDQQIIACSSVSIQFTGNTTSGSTQVAVSSISGLIAGQVIFGSGIPPGDTIASVGPGYTVTLTTAATAPETAAVMGVVGPSEPGCLSISPAVYGNGLAVDGSGNVYTAFGTGLGSGYIEQFPPGFSGPNGNGRAYSPTSTGFTGGAATPGMVGLIGLAADNAGQVFVDSGAEIFLYSPSFNGSTPTGNFIPVAGTGVNGYNGDNGTATLLQLDDSEGVALDENGALWIADTVNNRIREITPAGFGQGEGTGSVTGGSPAFGCLQCGPQSLGNGTGGVAGYGNQPAPTDTIQTDRISNVTLLNPANHKLYIAYPNALAVFNTSNDTVESTAGSVDVVLQTVTQMALDSATNDIWAITSAGQVLEINSSTDAVINGPFAVATGAQAQAIAVDSKLNQVYVAYGVTSGITVSYHLAVVNGVSGTTTTTLSLNGPAQAMVADSARGVAYLIAQDPYSACPSCPQYDYDIVVINGTTANKGLPIEITSTTTLIEGSEYSSGVTHSSLAIDPHTGKVVFADAVDAYFSLYNPVEPSYEATDHVSLGWIPNAVTIDTANSIAYITDSQYNNVQAVGLATVLNNTAFGWSYNLFSGTQGGNSCGFMANAVVPDASVGEVYITTCAVSDNTATPVLNQLQYTGVTANGSVLTPTFTCGYGPTCSPLDTYNLPLTSTGGLSSYTYVLNIDSSDHALFVQNGAGVPTGAGQPNTLPDILVFNGPYPPAARPQIQFAPGTTISFGNAPLGSTSSTTLTVKNIGAGSMLTPFFFDTGTNAADFSAGAFEPCGSNPLAPDGTCDVQLSFTPSRLAAESATFTVLDDSPDEPQTISVSGTGVLPVGSGATPSSTLLQVSALQVMPGNQLKLYATVSPAIGSSGEQVLFLDNNTSPATVLGSGTAAGGSVWTLSTSTLATGTHALTAYYAGDSTYAPSTSATVNVVISSSTGTGPSQPLLSFTPGSFYEAFNNTSGTTSNSDIAIDAAGDDFVLDSGVGSVAEYTVGGTTVSYVPAGSFVDPGGYVMTHPSGVAVAPTGGDVYITDTPSNVMAEATTAGSSFISNPEIYGLGACNGGTPTNFVTLSSPTGISIGPASKTSSIPNSAGYDLYLADSGNKRVLEINPVGGNTSQCGFYPGGVVDAILAGAGSPSGPTLVNPLSVAASGSNVFIADAPPAITNPSQGSGTIFKNGVAISNPDIVFPYSLAVDAAGDLYYSDESLSQVWRIDTVGNFLLVAGDGLNSAPGTPCTSATPCQATQTSILTPYGLAVSGNGSIFIGDTVATGQVGEVNVTTGMLSFPSQSTSTTSSALTVTVTDTASMPVGASGAVIAGTDMGDFAIAAGGTCNTSTGFTLNSGQSCTILVTFTPGATGTRTAVINLTTQSEIYGGTLQTIQLNGNGTAPGSISQTITFPAPLRPVVYGAAADTLSATATSGLAVQYSVLSGPGVLSGNTVSFTGAGTVKIVASQPGGTSGSTTYAAASSVEQDILVLPATLTVTAPPTPRVFEAVNPAFTASISGYVGTDNATTIGLTGSPTFTVAATGYPDSPVGTVIPVTTGLGTLALTSPNYTFSLVNSSLNVVCCEPQVIAGASLPSGLTLTVGTPFSLSSVSSSGLPVTYTVLSGPGVINTSPSGATLTATATGPITVQVSAAGNSNLSAAGPVVFTANPALTVNGPATLPLGYLNEKYNAIGFTAHGGKPPYTWSASGLPAGLTIDAATGVISGTPTADAGPPYQLTITATDANDTTAFVMSSLIVTTGPLTITTTGPLPNGTVGVPYSFSSFTASGGTGGYTWSFTGLPPGITPSGANISGTPTTAVGSPFDVLVKVTDSEGESVFASYTIAVSP
jgi:hypothetical protein